MSKYVAERFRGDALKDYPNIDGVVAFTHKSGCGITIGEPLELLQRVLAGIAHHPNIFGYVLIGLGCEVNQVERLVKDRKLDSVRPGEAAPTFMTIQNSGGAIWGRAVGDAQIPTVALELRWRSASGALDRSQRLSLPGVAFPGDRVDFEVPLVPPRPVEGSGPWLLSLVPVTVDDGTEVAVEKPVTVTVAR